MLFFISLNYEIPQSPGNLICYESHSNANKCPQSFTISVTVKLRSLFSWGFLFILFFFKFPGLRINFAPVISSPEFLLSTKVLAPNLTCRSFIDYRVLSTNMLNKGGICSDSSDSSNEMKDHIE